MEQKHFSGVHDNPHENCHTNAWENKFCGWINKDCKSTLLGSIVMNICH
jgi:hypothetical protein